MAMGETQKLCAGPLGQDEQETTGNKGIATRSKKLLVAPGITTRNKKLLVICWFCLRPVGTSGFLSNTN